MQHPYFLLLCLLTSTLTAQSFPGLNQDNYGGLYGVLLNPASLGGTRTNAEIHLASAFFNLQNDYATFAATDLLKGDGDAIISRTPNTTHTVYGNMDVLGPSLLLRLGERSGAALFTRARTVQSTRGINGYLLEGLYDAFDQVPDFDLASTDFNTNLHSWGEVGIAFGTTIAEVPSHRLRAGMTLKHLQGLGAVYSSGSLRAGRYDSGEARLHLDGELDFSRTENYHFDDLDLANRTSGLGFDAGLVYEWHPAKAQNPRYPLRYKLRAAVSVVDVGGINYAAETTPYLLSGFVFAQDIEADGDIEYVLQDNFASEASRREEARVLLPATLHALLDYRLTGKVYLSGLYSTGLRDASAALTSRVPSSLTFTARYEGRGLGVYLPVTLRSGVGATYGLGLRAGILTIGSGSLLSLGIGEGARAADVFLGIRFPFNRKNKKPGAGPQVQGA